MKNGKILALASMSLLMFGCKAETATDSAANTPTVLEAQAESSLTVAAPSPRQLLEQKLKKEMPYADLRKIVLSNGWLPLETKACKENVGGEAKICDQQPELESCSGDGHCVMWFVHDDSQTKLRVGTYGDATKFFEFSSNEDMGLVTISLSADACTLKGYWSFFESFVRSEEIRKSHTSPNIGVFSYADKNKIEGKYEGLKIGLVDNVWVYLDPAKEASSHETLSLKEKIIGNTFRVNYQKAKYGADEELLKTYGNPGAYLFELQNGCWQLTKEFR